MAIKSKQFKTIDGRVITCEVHAEKLYMKCAGFTATYKHSQVNEFLGLHSKIMTERALKEVRKFINESREPEQISLF